MAAQPKQRTDTGSVLGDRMVDGVVRGLTWLLMRLPYGLRVRLMGGFMARVVAPLAGYDKRIRDNLAYVCPNLPEDEVKKLTRSVPDNIGRLVMELFSTDEFLQRYANDPLQGEGVDALEEAHAAGRPVVLVTAHFGNFNVIRAALKGRGIELGSLYNPLKNKYFNDRYIARMSQIGAPMFPRGRSGYARMLKHLKAGNKIGILIDQHMEHGELLDFFGKPAPTALSAAEMALKYDALIMPIYGIRRPDGLNFDIVAEAPIPHTNAREMTQALNDSLEARVRENMDQWFWIHRRWKPERRLSS
ncbi:lauroyl acyltransferase [Actibacterium mucosum KCTC 23349]|uniref:Lauroyl acyltransferase n=1 Tax=Actibacterium mucosum KCTC 23349 TaxID=1454373 RepID=A0A037ZG34_9RHOB|nr:lysophospholipid acyltransferase family protein [Actibacterium mucosum]KAJ54578.1 lauroyl acyltransferase [Actibacterium mucosum KCTC 23349]